MSNTQGYYNTTGGSYDTDRIIKYPHYYKLLYDSAVSIVEPYIHGKKALEVGCGTGMVMERLRDSTQSLIGIDNSRTMLNEARRKGLDVREADANQLLPFSDNAFDVVYSFKVLGHVERIGPLIQEATRITQNGGHLILEFYNAWSIRRLISFLSAEDVYTRFDSYWGAKKYLPPMCTVEKVTGIRIISPTGHLYRIPILRSVLCWLERFLARTPLVYFASFLVLVCRVHKQK
ncbi:MAG: class I SAM-dependent methyltransferase [Patescibacteria group bacterium]|nr:class I SAM-dependent methyltransferase [Patescibacteria group bacterium]MDD5715955.1 class I SAM-dependent methyltransferase [Patescibacteria group bacterium]